jgi:NADPH:quinone reductase-like Zn-dependent oxidoreductase
MAATMLALRAHHRGGPETLVHEPAPRPAAGDGEVLVAVRAAAITFAELTWDATWQTTSGEDRTPTTPSHEFAGVVAGVGPGVSGLHAGEEVFGLVPFHRDGAAAQFVSVPAGCVARRPTAVPDVPAAAVSLAGLTAWQAVVGSAAVVAGEDVLVLGGTGGVGSLAVQLAAERGARVATTHRHADPGFLRGLGADRTLDVAQAALDARRRYDVVVDAAGTGPTGPVLESLRDGGRLVLLAAPAPEEAAGTLRARGIRATFFVVSADPVVLGELADRVAGGRLQVPIAAVLPLAEGRAAFESGGSPARRPGKVVLAVRP